MEHKKDFSINPNNHSEIYASPTPDKKKQNKEMLAISAMLLTLEETLSKASGLLSTGPSTTTAPSQGAAPVNNGPTQVNQNDFNLALGICAALLAQLQVVDADARATQARLNTDNDSATMNEMKTMVQQQMQQIQKMIQEQQEEAAEEAHKSFWDKLIEGLTFVFAILTMPFSFGAGAAFLTFAVLQYSGAMNDMIKGISNSLQKDGVPADKANLIAEAVMTAVSIVVTALSGGASLLSVAEDAESFTSQLASGLKKLLDGGDVTKAIILSSVEGAGNGIANTNLISDTASYVIQNNLQSLLNSPDKQKIASLVAGLIQTLLSTIMLLSGSVAGAMDSTEEAADSSASVAAKIRSSMKAKLAKIGEKISTKITNTTFKTIKDNVTNFAGYLVRNYEENTSAKTKILLDLIKDHALNIVQGATMAGTGAADGTASIDIGNTQLEKAEIQKSLANIQGAIQILQAINKYCQDLGQSQTQEMTTKEKGHAQTIDELINQIGVSGQALYQAITSGI